MRQLKFCLVYIIKRQKHHYIETCQMICSATLAFHELIPWLLYTLFLYKQRSFSTQSQCCLTFSLIEIQMLLRCFLIHISIVILRHFLYLLYVCPCQDLGLFMFYLHDLFFNFHLHLHYD